MYKAYIPYSIPIECLNMNIVTHRYILWHLRPALFWSGLLTPGTCFVIRWWLGSCMCPFEGTPQLLYSVIFIYMMYPTIVYLIGHTSHLYIWEWDKIDTYITYYYSHKIRRAWFSMNKGVLVAHLVYTVHVHVYQALPSSWYLRLVAWVGLGHIMYCISTRYSLCEVM